MAKACYQQWQVVFAAQPPRITISKAVSLLCKVISTEVSTINEKKYRIHKVYNNFKDKKLDKVINRNHPVDQ